MTVSLKADDDIELSFVIPCLDEAETIGACIAKASGFLETYGVSGEIVVADNGSADGSRELARRLGARVVEASVRGYGAALQAGLEAARGRYVIMGDADGSYDFADPIRFLEKLRGGVQLVIGNRFAGGIEPGAMPVMNRYLGNPVLTFIGRLFFKIPVGDFHCGLRGVSREALLSLDLRTTGMEYASEMIVRAAFAGLSMTEVPTTLAVDRRSRKPHLRPWRDGWRHLRFLLLFSPRWLFLYPGISLIGLGLAGIALLLPGRVAVTPGISLDLHTLLVACAALVLGIQSVSFALVTRQFATAQKFMPPSPAYQAVMKMVTLERLAILGILIFLGGLAGLVSATVAWKDVAFGELEDLSLLRLVIVSITALMTGGQMVLTGFLAGVIAIGQRD